MSEAIKEGPAKVRAEDAEACAAAWIERRSCSDWREADQEILDKWLAASPAHEVAFLRLNAGWNYADRLSVLNRTARPATITVSKRPFWIKSAIVLAIVLIAGLGSFYVLAPSVQQKTYVTGLGGHRVIALADGSRIELNTDTVLRMEIDSRTRRLWLEKGEAFFQVKHDAAHPFIVVAGSHRVTDLGTKFLIRRGTDRLEVTLLEGRARFDAPSGPVIQTSIDLIPGDHVTVANSTVIVTKQSAQALQNTLAWRRGLLIFDRTTLADAAAEFNRYNREKIVIWDASVARIRIGGTFRADNIGQFVNVTQDVLGLHVSTRGDVTVISH